MVFIFWFIKRSDTDCPWKELSSQTKILNCADIEEYDTSKSTSAWMNGISV